MAKKDASEAAKNEPQTEQAPSADKGSRDGGAVILPNGQRRIDYIRDNYYAKEAPYAHDKATCKSRGDIRRAINEMYKEAGQEGTVVIYQIIFGATKEKTDPRKKVAAPAAGTQAPTA